MGRWLLAVAWFLASTGVLLVVPLYLEAKLLLWIGVGWYADRLRRIDDQVPTLEAAQKLLLRLAVGTAVWIGVGALLSLSAYPGTPSTAAKLGIWSVAAFVAVWAASSGVNWLRKGGQREGYPPEWPTS